MSDDDEDVLRAALRAAHADDDPPPFRRARAPRRSFVPVAALAAVAVAAAVWLAWPRATPSERAPQPIAREGNYAIPEIASPTDFLLATPGSELLATTPSFSDDADVMKGTTP